MPNVTFWNTIPVNVEFRGAYTLNPLRLRLTLQPAPKGWDTLYHSDERFFDMTVSGELAEDQKGISNLVISSTAAKSGSAWTVAEAPEAGDGR